MPHDGLPVRAATGAHAATTDRRGAASPRRSLLRHTLPAALVAGSTVLAFAACSGTAGGSAGTNASTAPESSTAPSVEASTEASASAAGAVMVTFQAAGGSQLAGGAVLTDQPDGTTQVQITVSTGAMEGMAAVLEQGSCARPGGRRVRVARGEWRNVQWVVAQRRPGVDVGAERVARLVGCRRQHDDGWQCRPERER